MSTSPKDNKKTLAFIDPRKPVCKSDGCTTEANVRGMCRLHFLKSLKAKKVNEEEAVEREALARMSKDRRRSNRLMGMDDPESEDKAIVDVQSRFNTLDAIDLDIDTGLDGDDLGVRRKTGSDE